MIATLKPLSFLGDSLKALRAFPDQARQDAGFQLETSREDVALARKRFRDITGRTP